MGLGAGRRRRRAIKGLRAAVRYASFGMGLTRLLSAGFERQVLPWPTGFFAAVELAAGAALYEPGTRVNRQLTHE